MEIRYTRQLKTWLPDSVRDDLINDFDLVFVRCVQGDPQEFYIMVDGAVDHRVALLLDIRLSDYIIN
jgi:hypothetical protein